MLAALARDGDRSAFAEIVERTSDDVYSLALRLVGNEHDAADVLQETYLAALRGIGGFRGEARLTTWLHRLTINCASSLLAGRSHRPQLAVDLCAEPVAPPRTGDLEYLPGTLVDRARLVAALRRLPNELATVVVLRDVYDLPHAVIAGELNLSTGATRVRLHRARRELRAMLLAEAGDGGAIEQADLGCAQTRAVS